MAAYDKPRSGEWIQPNMRKYKLCCCDCGLVHVLRFRVVKGRCKGRWKVQFNGRRDDAATAAVRREHVKRSKHRYGVQPQGKGRNEKRAAAFASKMLQFWWDAFEAGVAV